MKDEKIRQSYNVTLLKNIEAILASYNLEVHANRLKQAIQNAAERTIPVKRKPKKPWISEETLEIAVEESKSLQDRIKRIG